MNTAPLLPRIFDFKRMFLEPERAEGTSAETGPGFPVGSVVVLQGPPGAGKSTFALAVARDLLFAAKERFLHYVSIESTRADLERFFRHCGWFGEGDDLFVGPEARCRVIVPRVHIERPVQSSENVINEIIEDLRRGLVARHDGNTRDIVVVDSLSALLRSCESPGEERRQAREFVYRLQRMFREHQESGRSDLSPDLVFLLSEQRLDSVQPRVEEYLGDFVIALALKATEPNTVRRTFSVTKSRGATMVLGESSWAILTSDHADRVISQQSLRAWIAERTPRTSPERWGTITVFPRPRLAAIGKIAETRKDAASGQQRQGLPIIPEMRTGIPGLDEMLSSKPEYWSRLVRAGGTHEQIAEAYGNPGLVQGTATLVVGPSGTGKTTMCLQFLLEEANADDALYVAFERPLNEAAKFYPGDDPDHKKLEQMPSVFRRRGNLDFNTLLAELEFHLARRRFGGKTSPIRRVALDGLSSLLATVKREDGPWLLETLLEFVRRHTQSPSGSDLDSQPTKPITIMLTAEFDPQPGADAALGISALADNVVTLRNLRINDQLRKAVYVEKARSLNHDRSIREFKIVKGASKPLRIHSGLEGYTGVLTSNPKPVTVVLQLFAENRAERRFNRWLERHLKERFHYDVETYGFSRDDITRTMHDAVSSAAGRLPDADIKVLSIDEWWIREHPVTRHPLLKLAALEYNAELAEVHAEPEPALDRETLPSPASPSIAPSSPREVARIGHVDAHQRGDDPPSLGTDERDFWVFEIDKTTVIRTKSDVTGSDSTGQLADADLLAVPAYTDFGLFCVSRKHLLSDREPVGREQWLSLVHKIPRLWARPDEHDPCWFDAPHAEHAVATLVDVMHATVGQDGTAPTVGFSFDMETRESAACMFFELAWSFGEPEGFLIEHAVTWPDASDRVDAWVEALPCTHALRFLQYLVLNGLMPARPTSRHLRDSLFSRHFYSTFRDELEAWRRKEKKPAEWDPVLIAPLMPAGPRRHGETSDRVVAEALEDAFVRLERFLKRLHSTYDQGQTRDGDGRTELEEYLREALAWREGPTKNDVRAALKLAEQLGDNVEKWLTEHSDRLPPKSSRFGHVKSTQTAGGTAFIPPTRGLTAGDVRELLKWHRFRLRIIAAELAQLPLRAVLEDLDEKGEGRLPQHPEDAKRSSSDRVTALAGYSCTGSWMVGVYWGTQSPGLSSKIVEEVVSLDSARMRASLGAGIPSRKDFYEFHGHEAVTGAAYLTWNQLLLLGDSRGRRRDRILCPHVHASTAYQLIYEGMMTSLETALAQRDGYRSTDLALRAHALAEVKRASVRVVRKLLEAVRREMRETPKAERRTSNAAWTRCAECPHAERCEKEFTES